MSESKKSRNASSSVLADFSAFPFGSGLPTTMLSLFLLRKREDGVNSQVGRSLEDFDFVAFFDLVAFVDFVADPFPDGSSLLLACKGSLSLA